MFSTKVDTPGEVPCQRGFHKLICQGSSQNLICQVVKVHGSQKLIFQAGLHKLFTPRGFVTVDMQGGGFQMLIREGAYQKFDG